MQRGIDARRLEDHHSVVMWSEGQQSAGYVSCSIVTNKQRQARRKGDGSLSVAERS